MEDEYKSAPAPESSAWSCKCGRTGNLGKFCMGCGRSRAEGEIPAGAAPAQAPAPRPAARQTTPPRPAPQQASPVQQAVPAQASSADNKTKVLIAAIVVLVLAIGAFVIEEMSSDTGGSSYQSLEKSSSSSSTAKPVREMKSDLSLGGLDLDMSTDDVRSALGQEKTSEQRGKFNFLLYDDVEVGTYENRVRALVSNSPAAATKRGIHEGSSYEDIKKAYGTDAMVTDYDDLTLYEYSFKSMSGSDGLLRFAVKKSDNTVKYISIRIPEDEKTAAKSGSQDANAAAQTLNAYYQDITSGKMDAAYGLLSSDMQRHMGTLDQFRQGYQTTISHQLSDVSVTSSSGTQATIAYTLTARDRTPSKRVKVQTFRCEATLSKATGSWHIVDMSAKKQGEHME